MKAISRLEELATNMIGDGKSPNLFFVTDQGKVVTITRNFNTAYSEWKTLASRIPRVESALEDRKYGEICSVGPKSEDDPSLVVFDDSKNMEFFRKVKA